LQNPFHGYESYLELAILADEAEQRRLALHFYREAMGMIEKTPDRSYRAVAHYLLAVAAMRVEDLTEAETMAKRIGELLRHIEVRIGYAVCPMDGHDADSLIIIRGDDGTVRLWR
jgi:hypothetical protein